ncbi:hypothetical protein EJ02DRAFT_450645 [Clathrospora elynae]|uniref:Uncharacterized protein n=1 Tax=Clathrospora elynae TaxID=706981 RepID=A0A6A5TBB4_9PLEO|nr:hypothetical protein EJ02DRAFT_450645 [Clathrospora elynae]
MTPRQTLGQTDSKIKVRKCRKSRQHNRHAAHIPQPHKTIHIPKQPDTELRHG